MAFRVIIDGYNLIGRQSGLSGDIEAKRDQLIDHLAQYHSVKGHPISVVFDGWGSGWPDEHGEVRQGIEVIFSRHGEKADDVIVRIARELGNGGLIVTSDRTLADHVHAAGGVVVSSREFEKRLSEAERAHPAGDRSETDEGQPGARTVKRGNPHRLSKRERRKRLRLGKL